jgi:malic enzyme
MRHTIKLALGLAAAGALAGCVEDSSSTTSNNPMFPSVGFAPEVSNAAVSACRTAVDAQTDGAVEVVGSEFSQANNTVYLTVGPQRAPWRCLVSNDGRVAEVMFVGSEGSL